MSRGRVVVYVHTSGPSTDSVPESGPAKVGLIVGKIVGNSVERHRAARRIRAVMASELTVLDPGSLVVVRALSGAATDPALGDDLRAGLQTALKRAHKAPSTSHPVTV